MQGARRPTESLSALTRYTQYRVIGVELCNQLSLAILGFAGFIAIKSLGASKAETVVLTNGSQIAFLLAYFFSILMAGRSKRPFLVVAGVLTRLSMCACAFVTESISFTIILCIAFLGAPIYVPAISALGQRNYRARHRGRVNGNIMLCSLLVLISGTVLTGLCLQENPDAFRWLFPCAGITGFIAYMLASRIRIRLRRGPSATRKLSRSFQDLKQILSKNRGFLHFEIAFFIYGIGFMLCIPTNIIVFTQDLHFTYQEFALGITVLSSLCAALCSPLSGRIFDNLGPTRSCSMFFLILAAHPLFMLLAYICESSVLGYLAYAIYGIGISGVNQSWHNGPMHYADQEDSALYMGIHMSNVGVRALIGSIILIVGNQATAGGGQLIPHQWIYAFSILLFIGSSIYMFFLKAPALAGARR